MNAFVLIIGILAVVVSFPNPAGLVCLVLCLIAVLLNRGRQLPQPGKMAG